MAKQQASNGFGVVEPSTIYTIEGFAQAIGRTPRWVREYLVNTGRIYHEPLTGLIPGSEISRFVLANLDAAAPIE